MTIGDRLRTERERLGFSQPDFAAIGGTTKKSQIDYEKSVTYPKANYLEAISKQGADVNYILTGKHQSGTGATQLTNNEWALIGDYRKLGDEGKVAIQTMINALTKK